MKIYVNYFKYYVIVFTLLVTSYNANAVGDVVGSGFSYQGELLHNGEPANGEFSIQIAMMLTETDGPPAVRANTYPNVQVTNGLFSIAEVDFGDAIYDGTEYWLQILVKKSSDPGFNHALLPRQRLSAVPYAVQAEFLDPGGASNGDILQFDGSNWVGQSPVINTPLWIQTSSNISYEIGKVGIGSGTSNPLATLHVNAQSGTGIDPFRVQKSGSTKLMVHDNGGVSIGTSGTAPDNGLIVNGDTSLKGDVAVSGDLKQPINSNGTWKYMVYATCGNSSSSEIHRSFNNTTATAPVIVISGISAGTCTFSFPENIHQRFFQASATSINISRGVTCWNGSITGSLGQSKLSCKRYNGTGSGSNGRIMVMVF